MGTLLRNLSGASPSARPLNLQGLLWGEEAGEALGQSPDRIDIQRVGTTKGVKNIRPGLSGFRIPDIVGQLNVGGGRSAFVFSGNRSNVHVYSNNMYYQQCQVLLYNSHAYMFFNFPEARLRDFNHLRHFRGQNMPTAMINPFSSRKHKRVLYPQIALSALPLLFMLSLNPLAYYSRPHRQKSLHKRTL